MVKISLLPARASCSIDALGIGPFGDVFEIGGLDLVAEVLDQRLAADLVLVGPAEIADRAEIDEADLELVGGGGAGQCLPPASEQRGGGSSNKNVFSSFNSGFTDG